MKNNGIIFKLRAIHFCRKLNIHQLYVLKDITNECIKELNRLNITSFKKIKTYGQKGR